MDHRTFDHLVAAAARRPSRRAALRLLAASALSAVLAGHAVPGRAAQRSDRDGDGLFDDDETDVYGTNPDVFDTDGDGVSDGQEIFNRDNGLGGNTNPLVNENAAPTPPPASNCPPGGPGTDCGGYCATLHSDPFNCGGCGYVCPTGVACIGGVCGGVCTPPTRSAAASTSISCTTP